VPPPLPPPLRRPLQRLLPPRPHHRPLELELEPFGVTRRVSARQAGLGGPGTNACWKLAPSLETQGRARKPPSRRIQKKKMREMDRDKQSSKHAFGAWSDPTNKFVDSWMASHRSVILVQLPDDSSLAGNGSSNCSSRFSSSSSFLRLAPKGRN